MLSSVGNANVGSFGSWKRDVRRGHDEHGAWNRPDGCTVLPRRRILDTDCASGSLSEKVKRLNEAINKLGTGGNAQTYASLLRQCAEAKALLQGKRLHALISSNSTYDGHRFLGNLVMHMYGSCGCLEDARSVFDNLRKRNAFSWNIMIAAYSRNAQLKDARNLFDKMPHRDVVSWNAMMGGYVQNGYSQEALKLFKRMDLECVTPNKLTFIGALDACGCIRALMEGKRIHNRITRSGLESDMIVGTALVDMYGKCGNPDDARRVFDNMRQRNMVSWNAMIAAYSQNGRVSDARDMFNKMPQRDVFSWTTLISAYSRNGQGKEALHLFRQMPLEGVKPNKITFICILDACANLAALKQGKEIHATIVNTGLELDLVLGTALVNMYGKCGSLEDARAIFNKIPQRDVVCWTAMITAYAQNGHDKEALELFQLMSLAGGKPNGITFTSILFACSHAGLLDDAWHYFVSMGRDHDIAPTAEHYGCMIDLIGRIGQLDHAKDLIKTMPFAPGFVTWMTLLGACRIHCDAEHGAHAAEHVIGLDSEIAAPYVLLSNIYAAAGRVEDVAKARKVGRCKERKLG